MNLLVKRSKKELCGDVLIPSSKSHSIRALLLATMASGESEIENLLESEDIDDAIRVCIALGANVLRRDSKAFVHGNGIPLKINADVVNTGNSGIATHFVLPMLGLKMNVNTEFVLDCGNQMRSRPIVSFLESLKSVGMKIEYAGKNNVLPINISGELAGGNIEVGGITSQYASALLLALPCAKQDSMLTVNNLHERPYLDMTLDWLNKSKITFKHETDGIRDKFFIKGNQHYDPFKTKITADYSSASYFMAAGVLTDSQIQLHGLHSDDTQGDKRFIDILQHMGADIAFYGDRLTIRGGKKLHGIVIDANDIPDLLPTLAVLGSQAEGKTEITNVKQARIKETDRIYSMLQGLRAMGVKIEERPDGLVIYQSQLHASTVQSYGDHRTAMAMAVAGMLCETASTVEGIECIDKSFPSFVTLMSSIGATMELST